jgi:hypothetical protein
VFAATLRPSSVVYREEQNFSWWVYALMALMVLFGIVIELLARSRNQGVEPGGGLSLGVPVVLLASLLLPTIMVVGVLRLTTEVDATGIRIWFGWIPTFQRAIYLADLDRVESVRYRPIADCGGWGIRIGLDGERVYNARGDLGVRLYFRDGTRILLGSQRPDELADAIVRALPPTS